MPCNVSLAILNDFVKTAKCTLVVNIRINVDKHAKLLGYHCRSWCHSTALTPTRKEIRFTPYDISALCMHANISHRVYDVTFFYIFVHCSFLLCVNANAFHISIGLCNDLRETKSSDIGSVGHHSYKIGHSRLLSMHNILPQYIVTHSVSPIIYGANIFNPLDAVAGLFRDNQFNTMTAEDPATQGARSSAVIILSI